MVVRDADVEGIWKVVHGCIQSFTEFISDCMDIWYLLACPVFLVKLNSNHTDQLFSVTLHLESRDVVDCPGQVTSCANDIS